MQNQRYIQHAAIAQLIESDQNSKTDFFNIAVLKVFTDLQQIFTAEDSTTSNHPALSCASSDQLTKAEVSSLSLQIRHGTMDCSDYERFFRNPEFHSLMSIDNVNRFDWTTTLSGSAFTTAATMKWL